MYTKTNVKIKDTQTPTKNDLKDGHMCLGEIRKQADVESCCYQSY